MWIQKNGYSKKVLLTDGKTIIQLMRSNPSDKVKPHHHKKQTEYFYILKGSAEIFIDNKEYSVKPGDILTCKPDQVHSLENNTNEPIETLVIKINWEENDTYW